jgi:hypothetical protein
MLRIVSHADVRREEPISFFAILDHNEDLLAMSGLPTNAIDESLGAMQVALL